jgi:hypothetical protein
MALAVVLLLSGMLVTGCETELDRQLRDITRPYRFGIIEYEYDSFWEEMAHIFDGRGEINEGTIGAVTTYFANVERIKSLEYEIAINGGTAADVSLLEEELGRLQEQNDGLVGVVEKTLETQIRDVLSEQGIYNPLDRYIGVEIGFPPLNFRLEYPPHLLVVSPRDRIQRLREVRLLPEMPVEEMVRIEEEVEALGYSALVLTLGGIATYPSFVRGDIGLPFTIAAATEEWLHQYLAFRPLGFGYVLDLSGVQRDYDIATMNETLVNIVSWEIADIILERYYGIERTDDSGVEEEGAFNFEREMRELRRAVDEYLGQGKIAEAEALMEQKRQLFAENGYNIRKLNQAYFAFYGTYAESPASIDPIGTELLELRGRCASLGEFLEVVASMNSHQDLADSIK